MKYRKIIRTAVCVLSVCVSVCAAGCSLSFCGFQIGGRDELTFLCEEEKPEEAGKLPVSKQEESRVQPSGQPEEGDQVREAVQSSAQPEEQDGAQEAVQSTNGSEPEPAESDGKVDINSAGVEELMTLKGIGETRARAIIEYRTQHGSFTKAEDIMQVPGIKEGVFSKIQNQIAVD